MVSVFYLAGAVVALVLIWDYLRHRRLYTMARKLPGSHGVPIFGSLLELVFYKFEVMDMMDAFLSKYKTVFKVWISHELHVFLSDPDDMEVVLSSTSEIEKGVIYQILVPWLGTGLLISKGQKWQTRRKMLTPTFHFRILEDFIDVFHQNSKLLVRNLKQHAGRKEPFDVQKYISMCTLDIICESAMGTQIHAQEQAESKYVKAVNTACAVSRRIALNPVLAIDKIFERLPIGKKYYEATGVIHDFTNSVIASRKKEIKELLMKDTPIESFDDGRKRRLAFLDQLLVMALKGENLSDEDIREEVDTFMFEGHDTTAVSLGFTCYLLSYHPDIQEEVALEVNRVLGSGDRQATIEDLQQLKILERVIKESLRLYPSVALFWRNAKQDIILPSGHTLPAGTQVALNVYGVHRNPDVYPDPQRFDPDRFLPENAARRSPFAYVPFSAGSRNCIGQKFAMLEMKSTLAEILRNYRLLPAYKEYNLHLDIEVVLRSTEGIFVKLEDRKKTL